MVSSIVGNLNCTRKESDLLFPNLWVVMCHVKYFKELFHAFFLLSEIQVLRPQRCLGGKSLVLTPDKDLLGYAPPLRDLLAAMSLHQLLLLDDCFLNGLLLEVQLARRMPIRVKRIELGVLSHEEKAARINLGHCQGEIDGLHG